MILAFASSVRLTIGSVVGRSYRLLHPIGEGGLSRVWVAEQIALERRVAIKMLTEGVIQTSAGLELFLREARATARVDHPHVVRILDFDVTDEKVPFLVLELLVGETLEQRLGRGPLALDEARAVLEQACDALAFAHECGILHRDIKAENIFLQRSRSGAIDLKLLDFGIALRKSTPLAHDPGVVGTPAYMSPEQLTGSDVDERCDLFSLAVCIYYALTKEYPYPGDSPAEAARAFATRTFTRPSALRPDLPATLDEWFARALAIDRAARFDDALSMLAAFVRACQPSRDTPVSVDVSGARARERSFPWRTTAALVTAAALVAAVRLHHRHPAPAAHHHAEPVVTAPVIVRTAPAPEPKLEPEPDDAIPVEMLPRPAAKKAFFFRAAPKPPARHDAGAPDAAVEAPKASEAVSSTGDIPEFGERE